MDFVRDEVTQVRPKNRLLYLKSGAKYDYDYLVLAPFTITREASFPTTFLPARPASIRIPPVPQNGSSKVSHF